MSDNQSIIQEEFFTQNNTATLFHRTKTVEGISNVLKSGWSSQGGDMYGVGVYTTYILEDQFRSYMSRYGNVLVKFKYTGLDNLLSFSPDVARKIHGDKYLLIDQLNKLVPNHGLDKEELSIFESYQSIAEESTYSSEAAKRFVDAAFFPDLHSKLAGIEYYGSHDGHCVVIYPPGKGIELISYVKNIEIDSDFKKLNWIPAGTKKTFTKAFGKGIFTTPDIELPSPIKKEEQIPFMEFIKKLKEKDEIYDVDVIDLFKYSFSNKSLLQIFEKLNSNLLRSDAYLQFFQKFHSRQYTEGEIKVLQVALQNRPSTLLEYLYKMYGVFSDSFKKEMARLLLTTNLKHLGQQGKNELGKVFSRLITDPEQDKIQLKQNITDYIIKNNLYEWFVNVKHNGTDILFQYLFVNPSDIIEFIKKAKVSNFSLNEIISYIADWFNVRYSGNFYTDDELISIIELLKEYSNTGQYFNSTNQGPVAHRIANIYLTRHPEQITAQILPSIVSSITEQNVDLLNNINPDLFKTADRIIMWQSLQNVIFKSKDATLLQKIWKYALLTTLDQNDYIEILNDLPTDASNSRNRNVIWETLFKNIVSTYILTKDNVANIFKKLRYPSDKIRELLLTELANANQFDESIVYLVLGSQNIFSVNIIREWMDVIHKKYPSYIKNILNKPEFATAFLQEKIYTSTNPIVHMYLTYAPEAVEKLTSTQLSTLLNKMGLNNINVFQDIKNLLKLYLSSDTILNKSDNHLQEIIFSKSPYLNKDVTDHQTVITVLEKLMSKNPNFISNFGGYYLAKFFENSPDKKFAADVILKYKNVNLNYNDFDKLLGLGSYANKELTPIYLINQILEIKKDKLDENSVNLLVGNACEQGSKLTSTQVIELLKKYNPNYVIDINTNGWTDLIIHARYHVRDNTNDLQYIEDLIFSLPISNKTNAERVKSALIETSKNRVKTINKILDSNKFTITIDTLKKLLQYTNDIATLSKIIKLYKFNDVDGKELAKIYNALEKSDDFGNGFINNKNALRLFLNEISNKLNALTSQEQIQFLSYTNNLSDDKIMSSPVQLITMSVRDIATSVFNHMLFDVERFNYKGRGPSTILKILLKYNNTGWNIENFFKAISSSHFKKSYYSNVGIKFKMDELFALVLKHDGQKLKARTLKAILDNSESTEERQKIIDIVLNPTMKGSNLDSNDVFVIVSTVNQMYDDTYSTKVILNILRLVNQNITDNMIVNLVGLCPPTINNQIGTEYVANRILLYLKDNLSDSAIYNLIRLQSEDDSKIRIINKILSTNKTLSSTDIYNIITLTPVKGLRDIANKLIVFYDKEYIVKMLKNRGDDPDTVLSELKTYKKYYYFKNISL